MKNRLSALVLAMAMIALMTTVPHPASASTQLQVTQAEYERATGLRATYQALALDIVDRGAWIEKTSRYWFRVSVKGGFEYRVADTASRKIAPAFDHARLAAALAKASGEKADPLDLPFSPFMPLRFTPDGKSVEFASGGFRYSCDLRTYECRKLGPIEPRRRGGMSMWERGPAPEAASSETKTSPDGRWEAFIRNYNVRVRAKSDKPAGSPPDPKSAPQERVLSTDGSEGDYYTFESLAWSPDSKKLAAYRLRRGFHRLVHYVESSPDDQLQPKHHTMEYAKPGDALDIEKPVLFDVEAGTRTAIDDALFPNPYEMSRIAWRKDSRAFHFEYNGRGHQVYRVIEVDAATGAARAAVNEEAATFFSYSGKKFRHDLDDGRETVWMSERDGWNHLYLIDGATGAVKNPITKGEWVVRSVDKVDEAARQVYFQASGFDPAQDPYFLHAFRVDLDGTGLVRLTEEPANHSVTYSPDMAFFVDTWSRVDLAPTTVIRRTSDKAAVLTLGRGDLSGLLQAGWRPPEVFTAKGRDGRTDIWGVIFRPTDFDPAKTYPVIEYIYAGPHSSHVPKSFQAYSNMRALAEMGFIVSQCDGMGTSNRSKAFHDVCWKDLGDAGFPDRILWHKAIAAKYPYYDIGRVGIYGNSAGGQNALGALLFHPEFYKAAVSSCGCHDNRMDKIWWNEQWMGWPIGPEYAASSNVDNAPRLEGQLLLILGEMDTNVDPSSTMQVVDALIKAGKYFDLLVIPGGGHGMGGPYGERKMFDFFRRALAAGKS